MRVLAAVAAIAVMAACSAGEPVAAGDPSPPATTAAENPPAGPLRPRPPAAEERPVDATPATPASPTRLSERDQSRLDARLLAAAWRNDLAAARRLVAAGADVNAKDDTVQSAYLVATSEGYLDLLDLTLRHGADLASLDSYRGTGLIRAAERGHADIVGRLLQAGPPPGVGVNHVNNLGWTALLEAVILGDGSTQYVDTVRVLVAGGADVHLAAERDGLTPIAHAEALGQTAVLETLRAAARADSRPRSPSEADAALLRVASTGDADAAALALRDGARLEVRDDRGRTPLLLAALGDHVGVARLLVVLGADPVIADSDGVTALRHARASGQGEVARILVDAAREGGR